MDSMNNVSFEYAYQPVRRWVAENSGAARRRYPLTADTSTRRRYRDVRPSISITADAFVTSKQICERLKVTLMTVNKWREGSPVRRALPFQTLPRGKANTIIFQERDLIEWLTEYRPDLAEMWECQV